MAALLFLWACSSSDENHLGSFQWSSASGETSLSVNEAGTEAMQLDIGQLSTNQFIEASVLRSDMTKKGWLRLTNDEGEVLAATNFSLNKDETGYDRLLLRYTVPPGIYNQKMRVSVVNETGGDMRFDQLNVMLKHRATYPEYADEKRLDIHIPRESYESMKSWRDSCYKYGMIISDAQEYFDASLKWEGKKIPIRIRLKGDMLEHVNGIKWSFRIRVEGENSVMGMKSFSLHDPAIKNYLDEWMMHQMCTEEDVLTTRYSFIPVRVNDKSLGIYAMEEHFQKQLVESRSRREGPIVKFNEDGLWEYYAYLQEGGESLAHVPVWNAALIEPFKRSRILGSPVLKEQFLMAQEILKQQVVDRFFKTSGLDQHRIARYHALITACGSSNSSQWHNQRWYYNPVTCQLEPIGYNFFHASADAVEKLNGITPDMPVKRCPDELKRLHNSYLETFSNPAYSAAFRTNNEQELKRYQALLQEEFGHLDFPGLEGPNQTYSAPHNTGQKGSEETVVFKNASVNAYLEDTMDDTIHVIAVQNWLKEPISIIGHGRKKSQMIKYDTPFSIPPTAQMNMSHMVQVTGAYRNIYFSVPSSDKVYSCRITPWKMPTAQSSPLQYLQTKIDLIDNRLYTVSGDTIRFRPGLHAINEDVVFPEGFHVIIEGPCQFVLNRNAAIISRSPLHIEGTANAPIQFSSTDGTGEGLTVLQTGENQRSTIKYVDFINLNTPSRKGWQLTGSVTFYESNVDISNCNFSGNNCEDALNTIRSDFSVVSSTFTNTFGDAFDADFCTGKVVDCTFDRAGNDAIDFSGSVVTITGCNIDKPGDKGVSGGENSTLTIENLNVYGGVIALASKDLSSVEVKNVNIIKSLFAYAAFRKKPEFGPATIRVTDGVASDVNQLHAIETGSLLLLESDSIKGSEDISKYKWYQ